MKVAILGSGGVGQDLGLGFLGLGHDVKMGSRDPGKKEIREWLAKAGLRASAGTFGEAAAFGDMAVRAVDVGDRGAADVSWSLQDRPGGGRGERGVCTAAHLES